MVIGLQSHAQMVDYLSRRLISPMQQLQNQTMQLKQLQNRLAFAMQQQLQKQQQKLLQLKSSIEQLSPQAILARGYAIVTHNEKTITDSAQLQVGNTLNIQLKAGNIDAHVTKKSMEPLKY